MNQHYVFWLFCYIKLDTFFSLVTVGTVLGIRDQIMTKTEKNLYSNWEISVHFSCFEYFLTVKVWFCGRNSRLGLQTSNLSSGTRQLLDFVVVHSVSRV